MNDIETTDMEQESLLALRRLARSPKKGLNWRKLWTALTSEEKVETVGHLLSLASHRKYLKFFGAGPESLTDESLEKDVAKHRSYVVEVVTKTKSYRKATVEKMPVERLAAIFATADLLPTRGDTEPLHPASLFAALHIFGRLKMVCEFYNGLDVPHRNGLIDGINLEDLERSEDQINDALFRAQKVSEGLGERWVLIWALYFLLQNQEAGFASQLRDHLAERCRNDDPIGDHNTANEAEEMLRGRSDHLLQGQTLLDSVLITTIVATRSGIDGALPPDDADELVNEVLASNISHQQRYFHRGFYDALFDRRFNPSGPELNNMRRRWYWAGVVVGLTRTAEDTKILELYDAHETIRRLGDGQDGASEGTVRLLVAVLAKSGREEDIRTFVPGHLVFQKWGSGLFDDVLEIAERLLRENRVSHAKKLFDRLADVVDEVEEHADERPLRLTVERRQAQCAQRNGDFPVASRLTQRLLKGQADEELLGKLYVDLGLIKGKLQSLAEVKLPSGEEKRNSFISSLKKGREQFKKTEAYPDEHRSHADLCLGVLLLNEEGYDEAVARLDNARGVFVSDRVTYSYGQIIERTELYLGIAIFGAHEEGRFREAYEMIQKAVAGGVVFPHYLLPQTLEHMQFGFGREAGILGDLVLSQSSDMERGDLLDALGQCEAKEAVSSLANYYLQRAKARTRTPQQQASDYYAALPLLLQKDSAVDEAGTVLDQLEQRAMEGIEAQRFCDRLESGDCDQVWSRAEVLGGHVRVLSARGKTEKAGQLLGAEFHKILTEGDTATAEGLLEEMRSLGVEADATAPLEKRLNAARADATTATENATADAKPVKVLFVGGDESYAKFDEELRDMLRIRDSAIEVEFIRSGWTSNWNVYLDTFKRKVPDADAVVVTRYIRTEFGRSVRKAIPAGIPWQACWKPSTGLAVKAIINAAHMVRA